MHFPNRNDSNVSDQIGESTVASTIHIYTCQQNPRLSVPEKSQILTMLMTSENQTLQVHFLVCITIQFIVVTCGV